jgi:hypothetical protein
MRSIAVTAIALLAISSPLLAQNTDIEALSGLQFNFGNPGARSLGMGGAPGLPASHSLMDNKAPKSGTHRRASHATIRIHA